MKHGTEYHLYWKGPFGWTTLHSNENLEPIEKRFNLYMEQAGPFRHGQYKVTKVTEEELYTSSDINL